MFKFYVLLLFVSSVYGQGCILPEVTPEQWNTSYVNFNILDTFSGTLKNFQNVSGVLGISGISGYSNYLTVVYDLTGGTVTISTSEAFKNFENEIPSQIPSPFNMNIGITFRCDGGDIQFKTLKFVQPINDTNNHGVSFNKEYYNFTLPMPFPPVYFGFSDIIYATKIDFSTQQLVFLLEGIKDDFDISYGSVAAHDPLKKSHVADLRARKYLQLTEPVQLKIMVHDIVDDDNGFQWFDTADIYINIDHETSLPRKPKFSQYLYSAIYEIVDGVHSLKMNEIVLLSFKPLGTEVTLDNNITFSIRIVLNQVYITLNEPLDDAILYQNSYHYLKLTASVEGAPTTDKALIAIKLPGKCASPKPFN